MKVQYIDNILCVGEINEDTSHVEFYSWDLGANKQDHPKNFLRLDGALEIGDKNCPSSNNLRQMAILL